MPCTFRDYSKIVVGKAFLQEMLRVLPKGWLVDDLSTNKFVSVLLFFRYLILLIQNFPIIQ